MAALAAACTIAKPRSQFDLAEQVLSLALCLSRHIQRRPVITVLTAYHNQCYYSFSISKYYKLNADNEKEFQMQTEIHSTILIILIYTPK